MTDHENVPTTDAEIPEDAAARLDMHNDLPDFISAQAQDRVARQVTKIEDVVDDRYKRLESRGIPIEAAGEEVRRQRILAALARRRRS